MALTLLSCRSMNSARAKTFIHQLMAFILLSLSSYSTEAAQLCQDVFSPSSNLILEVQALRESLTDYRAARNSPEMRPALAKQLQEMDSKVQKHLESQGILYERKTEEDIFLKLELSTFEILPQGPHWLNKMAKELKEKAGVTTAFTAITKTLENLEASYDKHLKTINLSTSVLYKKHAGDAEIHETMHAFFHATREGLLTFMPKAPVHIDFHAQRGIDPQAKKAVYQKYMSFEEIVTYAYNISYPAIQLLKGVPSARSLDQLERRIQSLLQVSRNAEIAAARGISLLQQGNKFVINVGSDNYMMLGKQGPDTYLEVSLKPMPKDTTPEQYVLTQLQNAQKLAEFNQKYFADKDQWSPQLSLEKARDFRNAQRDFIESL